MNQVLKRKRRPSWRTFFMKRKVNRLGQPVFELKSSPRFLGCYDGYAGGHEILDFLVGKCEEHQFRHDSSSSDSPLNVSSFEDLYWFEDGGLLVYAGNYISEEKPLGAYLVGFDSFCWALRQMGLTPPLRSLFEKKSEI